MGAAMNPPNMSNAQAPQRRRGRWQLILIVLMVIVMDALSGWLRRKFIKG